MRKRDSGNPCAELGLVCLEVAAGQRRQARERLEVAVGKSNYRVGYDLLPTGYDHLGETNRADAIRARAKASGAYVGPVDPRPGDLLDDCYNTCQLSMAVGTAAQRGAYQSALHLVERALKLAAGNGTLYFQLGIIHLEQKDYIDAEVAFKRCTELKPTFADGWGYLHKVYQTLGESGAAARVLAHCPDFPSLHLAHARQLVVVGEYAGAIPEFQKSIRLRPDGADAYIELASDYFRLNEIDKGVAELHRSLEAVPENPTALSTLAFYSISIGDEAAARKFMRRVRRQVRVGSKMIDRLTEALREKFGTAP